MTATAPRAPTQLGSYVPLMELAAGGMATVYVARKVGSAGFSRLVVVKRVHPHLLGNREFYDMFRDEARVASLIRHPNVVPVTDVVELEGELLLVMEYIDSVSLGTLVKEATGKSELLPYPVVARVLLDVLAGLHAAHEAVDMLGSPLHVVHRDVSPQNMIVGSDGLSRVIDFGIAQAADRLTDTKTGSLKGKLAYMAPEQAAGQKDLDRRIDVFAAGVTLFEALTGTRLFRGNNDVETLKRILEIRIPPPSELRPDIPKALDEVTLRALSRNPDARYPSAQAFHEALEAAVDEASLSEVAAVVKRYAGDRLESRARRLRAVVEGTMSMAVPIAPSSSPSVSGPSLPGLPPGEPKGEGSGTGATAASLSFPSLPASSGARRKSTWAMVAVGGVALLGVGVGLGLFLSSQAKKGSKASVADVPAISAEPSAAVASPTPSAIASAAPEPLAPATGSAPESADAGGSEAVTESAPAQATTRPASKPHAVTRPRATEPKKKTAKELQANPYK